MNCVICLEHLAKNEIPRECGHTFHLKCLRNLRFPNAYKCPLCRRPIEVNRETRANAENYKAMKYLSEHLKKLEHCVIRGGEDDILSILAACYLVAFVWENRICLRRFPYIINTIKENVVLDVLPKMNQKARRFVKESIKRKKRL